MIYLVMNNYTFIELVGEGTYGEVIKSRCRHTDQIVAIKRFKENASDERVRKPAMREQKLLQLLKHPNIINMHEAFSHKDKLYIVFDYVKGTLLDKLLESPKGLSKYHVKLYAYQLLCGIEFCHRNGVIHRDIKPENILISGQDELKICDFGFARWLDTQEAMTDYISTRWYRSPELLVGDLHYDSTVDIWAFGCIVAEATTGEPLFPGRDELDQLQCIVSTTGSLPTRQRKQYKSSINFREYPLPRVPGKLNSLRRRFPTQSKQWHQLMEGCICNDPSKRLSCTKLLKLPYFAEVRTDKHITLPYTQNYIPIQQSAPTLLPSKQINGSFELSSNASNDDLIQKSTDYFPMSTFNSSTSQIVKVINTKHGSLNKVHSNNSFKSTQVVKPQSILPIKDANNSHMNTTYQHISPTMYKANGISDMPTKHMPNQLPLNTINNSLKVSKAVDKHIIKKKYKGLTTYNNKIFYSTKQELNNPMKAKSTLDSVFKLKRSHMHPTTQEKKGSHHYTVKYKQLLNISPGLQVPANLTYKMSTTQEHNPGILKDCNVLPVLHK